VKNSPIENRPTHLGWYPFEGNGHPLGPDRDLRSALFGTSWNSWECSIGALGYKKSYHDTVGRHQTVPGGKWAYFPVYPHVMDAVPLCARKEVKPKVFSFSLDLHDCSDLPGRDAQEGVTPPQSTTPGDPRVKDSKPSRWKHEVNHTRPWQG